MRKPAFCICENKDADQLHGNREADQCLCFRYRDSTIPLLLKPVFQASSCLLWLHSPVCVGPGQKPRRPGFSQRGSYLSLVIFIHISCYMKNPAICAASTEDEDQPGHLTVHMKKHRPLATLESHIVY